MTDINFQDAIRKARACLRLATSSNPNEAALAAARAQEIMDKYRLDMAEVGEVWDETRASDAIVDHGDDPLDSTRRRHSTWCGQLAAGLGGMNAVIVYRTKLVNGTQILKLIGRKEDVEIVRSLYTWLRSETMRLLKENVPPGVRGKIIRAYCLGVVETILKRLRREQEKTFAAASTMAVMRVQNQLALVQKWTDEQKKLKKSGGRIGSQDAEGAFARVQGRIDGNKARLTPAKELGQ